MSMSRKVVVTGYSIGSPAGYTLEENRACWTGGKYCFSEITTFNLAGSSVRFAGQCPKPDVKKLPDRKVQKILTRKDVISLLVTLDAAQHAGLKAGTFDPERCGMYVGAPSTQIGDLTEYFTIVKNCVEDGKFDSKKFGRDLMELVNPLVVLQTLMNNGLCFGTMSLDIRGVNANFMDFQASGLRAVGEAFRSIVYDRADVIVAGGIAGTVEPFHMAEGVRAGFIARTIDPGIRPEETVRPYDATRRGAILSDGAAYMVLEEESHAIKRGATIYGRLHGFGLANDGAVDFMREEKSPGLGRAIVAALQDAGMDRGEIGLIEGQGNGSGSYDMAEASAILDVYGKNAQKIPLHSCKGVMGEMGEAAGVVSLIIALEALKDKVVPKTFNFHEGDEVTSQCAVRDEVQEVYSDKALVVSRNFLGLAAAMVVSLPD